MGFNFRNRYHYGNTRNIPISVVKKIFIRDKGECIYCGSPAMEIDHVVSYKEGGLTIKGNLVCVCLRCNRIKAGAKGQKKIFYITKGLFWLMQHGENTDWVDKL